MTKTNGVVIVCAFVCIISLSALTSTVKAESTGNIFINADGSISGTSHIQRDGNVYRLTRNLYATPIVVLCNNIVLDGVNFTLQGAGGWGIPGASGVDKMPAINLTCSNVTVRNFNIIGWETGVLGAYNSNTIFNNNITAANRAVAIYASNYNITGNYLANSIYAIRIKGDNNYVSQNQLVNNYGGVMMSYSSDTLIVANNFANNSTAVNVDNSPFKIYHNNFLVSSPNTSIVSATLDAIGFNVGIVPTWDNGSEGNYWSDYKEKYPYATEIDHTGIGNTPYVIRFNPPVTDWYPLITPVNIQNVTLPSPSPSTSPSLAPSQTPISSPISTSTGSPAFSASPFSSEKPSPTVPEITFVIVLALIIVTCIVALVFRNRFSVASKALN